MSSALKPKLGKKINEKEFEGWWYRILQAGKLGKLVARYGLRQLIADFWE